MDDWILLTSAQYYNKIARRLIVSIWKFSLDEFRIWRFSLSLSFSLSIKSVIFKLIFLPPLKSLHLKITSEKKKKNNSNEETRFQIFPRFN